MTSLPPPPARDLPPGRHEFHKERLMTQIDNDTRTPYRRPFLLRPAFALSAVALVAVVGAGIVVTQRGDDATPAVAFEPAQTADPNAGTPDGVAQLVNRMVLVAATREDKPATAGDWVYISSKSTDTFIRGNADTGEEKQVATASDRQVWRSLDGARGWLIQSGVDQKEGGETLDSGVGASVNGPSYDFLAELPTDPGVLLAKIYKDTEGQGNGPDSQAFSTVGDLLGESYPPAALYPALYRTAAKIPGVLVVDDAVDAAGRHGVALARVDEGGVRYELIFDKKDYTYLGQRQVLTRDDSDGMKAGTVTFSMAILDRALVGAMKQVP
ncbi:CU044_5270 family protein [Actinoplanes sp. NPDC051494]|uniref:CU044_5270 family protein n=1 Tax=Actinoplanes sp. NPDC051494 TaxID=3363907 RepID=UPI0037940C43